MLYGLKHPIGLVLLVLTLLAYGCPIPAIVATFELDQRTIADWQLKAGRHARQVQEQVVCQGQLDVGKSKPTNCTPRPKPGRSGSPPQ